MLRLEASLGASHRRTKATITLFWLEFTPNIKSGEQKVEMEDPSSATWGVPVVGTTMFGATDWRLHVAAWVHTTMIRQQTVRGIYFLKNEKLWLWLWLCNHTPNSMGLLWTTVWSNQISVHPQQWVSRWFKIYEQHPTFSSIVNALRSCGRVVTFAKFPFSRVAMHEIPWR